MIGNIQAYIILCIWTLTKLFYKLPLFVNINKNREGFTLYDIELNKSILYFSDFVLKADISNK
jgi:hypothetical protein